MKALSFLLFAMLGLTGCASPQMKEDDAFLWGDQAGGTTTSESTPATASGK